METIYNPHGLGAMLSGRGDPAIEQDLANRRALMESRISQPDFQAWVAKFLSENPGCKAEITVNEFGVTVKARSAMGGMWGYVQLAWYSDCILSDEEHVRFNF